MVKFTAAHRGTPRYAQNDFAGGGGGGGARPLDDGLLTTDSGMADGGFWRVLAGLSPDFQRAPGKLRATARNGMTSRWMTGKWDGDCSQRFAKTPAAPSGADDPASRHDRPIP